MSCESCEDRGWVLSQVSGSRYVPEMMMAVERCDTCMKLADDVVAQAQFLFEVLTCRAEIPGCGVFLVAKEPEEVNI